MRIFVFGNINSGKSFVIEKLKIKYSNLVILKIDEYRLKFGDNTWDGELKAQSNFLQDILANNNCIVECTGLGPLGDKLSNIISYKKDLILHIRTDLDTCLKRIKNKNFSLTPYPKVSEKIEDTIIRSHNDFNSDILDKLWKHKVLNIIEIDNDKDIASIPFEHYIEFSDIIKLLYPIDRVKTIYPFGSFARNELTKLSDIDCYIGTEMSTQEVFNILGSNTKCRLIDTIKNKITLRYKNDLLIELVIVEKLSEGERYIIGTLVENTLDPLIKYSKEDYKYLTNLHINQEEPIDDIDSLISNMMYFVYSLPKLIIHGDKYKYYFHNNIIIHNYIRISEIIKGNTRFNHLPKVDLFEYQNLLNNEFNDLNRHYIFILKIVSKQLTVINNKLTIKHLRYLKNL